MPRLVHWCFCAIVCLLLGTTGASAQFPNRPIHLVVPYPPGGLVDTMARTVQEPLSAALGQPVIVDNKPGAAGAIATRFVAQSPPDGYTLIFGNNGPSALLPLIQKDAGYDPIADFTPITMVATAPMIIVIHENTPAKNLKEFIAYARQNPGTVAYSTAGVGSLGHLTSELFAQMAGIKLVHIPYKGSAPAGPTWRPGPRRLPTRCRASTYRSGTACSRRRIRLGRSSSGSIRHSARCSPGRKCRRAFTGMARPLVAARLRSWRSSLRKRCRSGAAPSRAPT